MYRIGGIFIKYDLHIHTNNSDGRLSPYEVVDIAIEKGLQGISITDHDTVDGVKEAIDYAKDQIIVIPGIEFSCRYKDEEIHILGYFIDYENEELISLCNKLRESRKERSLKILKKLNYLGLKIEISDIEKYQTNEFTGRFHIAKAMVDLGYVKNTDEAFELYLDVNMPAYVERKILTVQKTVKLIKSIGGIAVLAHPILLNDQNVISKCIEWGIDGIECIHSKHTLSDSKHYIDLCHQNNLLITGGSDCHGVLFDNELLLGNYFIQINKNLKSKEDLKCLQVK